MEWLLIGQTDTTSSLAEILKQKRMSIGGVKSNICRLGKISKNCLVIIDSDAFSMDEFLYSMIEHREKISTLQTIFLTSESKHALILEEFGLSAVYTKQELMVDSLLSELNLNLKQNEAIHAPAKNLEHKPVN